jgi:hypothetical protein
MNPLTAAEVNRLALDGETSLVPLPSGGRLVVGPASTDLFDGYDEDDVDSEGGAS